MRRLRDHPDLAAAVVLVALLLALAYIGYARA